MCPFVPLAFFVPPYILGGALMRSLSCGVCRQRPDTVQRQKPFILLPASKNSHPQGRRTGLVPGVARGLPGACKR